MERRSGRSDSADRVLRRALVVLSGVPVAACWNQHRCSGRYDIRGGWLFPAFGLRAVAEPSVGLSAGCRRSCLAVPLTGAQRDLLVLPGDGIRPEIVAATQIAENALGNRFVRGRRFVIAGISFPGIPRRHSLFFIARGNLSRPFLA